MRTAPEKTPKPAGKRALARAVGSFVPSLTRKAFEKYGFSTASLLTDWQAIAGAELAAFTVPERLTWPKGAGQHDDAEAGARGRPGARLVLRVDTARVLDVEYRKHQIIERINAHFGYRAVAELRFVQAPVAARPQHQLGASVGNQPKPRDVVQVQAGRAQAARGDAGAASDSGCPELDAALARLARSVLGPT